MHVLSFVRALRCPPLVLAAVAATSFGAAGAGAATLQRFTVTQTANSGSLGATTFDNASTSGGALQGQGGGAPDTAVPYPFGVFGEYNDNSSGTFGIGTIGVSTTGYGVAAESIGPNPAMFAIGKGTGGGMQIENYGPGTGLQVDNTGTGTSYALAASGNAGAGVYAYSKSGLALVATTPGAGGVAQLGQPTGEGVMAYGYSGNTSHPVLTATDENGGSDLIASYTYAGGTNPESFIVQGSTVNRSRDAYPNGSDVQISGDLYVYGKIFQDCGNFPAVSSTYCYDVTTASSASTSGVTRTSTGADVATYAPRQGAPTVEDVGAGHMVNGAAYVRLDPTFASTISTARPYAVFITPGGDSRGVFVTRKSTGGFEVRENMNGRSNLDFDYRIVASPLGNPQPRFPQVAAHPKDRVAAIRTDPTIARMHKPVPGRGVLARPVVHEFYHPVGSAGAPLIR